MPLRCRVGAIGRSRVEETPSARSIAKAEGDAYERQFYMTGAERWRRLDAGGERSDAGKTLSYLMLDGWPPASPSDGLSVPHRDRPQTFDAGVVPDSGAISVLVRNHSPVSAPRPFPMPLPAAPRQKCTTNKGRFAGCARLHNLLL